MTWLINNILCILYLWSILTPNLTCLSHTKSHRECSHGRHVGILQSCRSESCGEIAESVCLRYGLPWRQKQGWLRGGYEGKVQDLCACCWEWQQFGYPNLLSVWLKPRPVCVRARVQFSNKNSMIPLLESRDRMVLSSLFFFNYRKPLEHSGFTSLTSALTLWSVLVCLVPFLHGAECFYELNIIFARNRMYFWTSYCFSYEVECIYELNNIFFCLKQNMFLNFVFFYKTECICEFRILMCKAQCIYELRGILCMKQNVFMGFVSFCAWSRMYLWASYHFVREAECIYELRIILRVKENVFMSFVSFCAWRRMYLWASYHFAREGECIYELRIILCMK